MSKATITYEYPAVKTSRDIRIENMLAQHRIPAASYSLLVPLLSVKSLGNVSSALQLYEGLEGDDRLTDEQRIGIIPKLVQLVITHGRNGEGHFHVDTLVDLTVGLAKQKRDGKIVYTWVGEEQPSGNMPYGSETVAVLYGQRRVNNLDNYKSERRYKRRIRVFKNDLGLTELSRLEGLLRIIRGTETQWAYAEKHLLGLNPEGSIFNGNRSFYMDFLNSLGSIIKQKLNATVQLLYYPGTQVPNGFEISEYKKSHRAKKEAKEKNPRRRRDNGTTRTRTFRHRLSGSANENDGNNGGHDLLFINKPQKPLEQTIAKFSRRWGRRLVMH